MGRLNCDSGTVRQSSRSRPNAAREPDRQCLYRINPETADPASIRLSEPNPGRDETGLAVEIACSKNFERSCFEARLGDFGGYQPCSKRACDLPEREIEDATLGAAKAAAQAKKPLRIACPDLKSCKELGAKLRRLLDLDIRTDADRRRQ